MSITPKTPKTPLDRIIADNDPRNSSIGERLIRMLEQPDRQPDSNGLYRKNGPGRNLDGELDPPQLRVGGLSNAVYVVTHGKQKGNTLIASQKYDVTDQFEAVAKELGWFSPDGRA